MVQIDMQKPDHCIRCLLLNDDDMCCLQDYEGQEEKWDWTWEQQMQNCPLKEVDPVVRCGQCGYWHDNDGDYGYCYAKDGHGFGHAWGKNDFCSYGKKKENKYG